MAALVRRHLARALAAAAVIVVLTPVSAAPAASRSAIASRCFTIASAADGDVISLAGPRTYRALARPRASAAVFHFKPTGFGTYLLHDPGGRLLGVEGGAVTRVGGAELAGAASEWSVRARGRTVAIRHTADGRLLLTVPRGGGLALRRGKVAGRRARFTLSRARVCNRFPEAQAATSGRSRSGARRDGTVPGYVDTHLHITADLRAGGSVIHGRPYHRYGIARALDGDADVHGADGSRDVTGNLLRDGIPFGTHDTRGWPTFSGWPVFDTNTHQQTYWVWLQRAWKAGLRLVVAQAVEDDQLCIVEPVKSHPCDETETIALQVRRLRGLQRYVDAQYGGPGRGWFRLVYGPRQARQVIEEGKLAVVIGVESSNVFGCGLREGVPECDRADVDRGIRRFRRLGVRSLFVAHWFDNALAGAALEGGVKGKFINAMNALRAGSYFASERCPSADQGEEMDPPTRLELTVLAPFFPAIRPLFDEPVPPYPPGKQCNARGLTALGEYAVRRLMDNHMLIDLDHISERARDRVLAIARSRRYPLMSSHNGTGGAWTPAQIRALNALGGLASVTPGDAPAMVEKILAQRQFRSPGRYFGVGLGTDTGGFSSLPGPRSNTTPLRYPFRSYDGRVIFGRQRTGSQTYDLNVDGVAHYGLFADLLADIRRQPRGGQALATVFRSAEAYLRMWRRSGERH